MDIMDIDEKMEKIAITYGYETQSMQCIEEMAELTQAISKYRRRGCKKDSPEYRNLIEEIADVYITLWQIEYLLEIEITSEMIDKKLDRQLERIKEEKENAREKWKSDYSSDLGKTLPDC